MPDYKVQFEVFEGPLDLLLYLVKKQEVDIYEVNLTRLAEQFIRHVEAMRQLDLEVAGEFLVMAATLMYIKSRELLPVDQQVQAEGEDEGEDPRWELIRQLVEYRKFKDAAGQLQQFESRQERVYPRNPPKLEPGSRPLARPGEVTVFDLIQAVSAILKRFESRDTSRDVFEDRWTVSEKIGALSRMVAAQSRILFSELFEQTTSRTEVVVTFLALLELIRLRQVTVVQAAPFSDMEILRPAESSVLCPAPAPAEPAAAAPAEPTHS